MRIRRRRPLYRIKPCESEFLTSADDETLGEDQRCTSELYYFHIKRTTKSDEGDLRQSDPRLENLQHASSSSVRRDEVQHGQIPRDEFLDWAHQRGRYVDQRTRSGLEYETLRLLIITICRKRPMFHMFLPFPFTAETFQEFSSVAALPDSYLDTIRRCSAVWSFEPATDGRHGYILHNNYSSHVYFNLAGSYNPSTRTTYAVLLGVRSKTLQHLRSVFTTDLSESPLQLLVPMLVLDHTTNDLREYIFRQHKRIYDVEGETGMTAFEREEDSTDSDMSACDDEPDLDVVMKKLTACQAELGYVQHSVGVVSGMIDTVRNLIDPLHCFPDKLPDHAMHRRRFTAKIDTLASYLQYVESRTAYLMTRALGQVQTVYTIIGRRDNAANQQAARASLRLAELSRRDNMAMMSIAEDSRHVAILTSQDSAAMRVIAAVTILFLPATFMATFFSTSFFNFQRREGDGSGGGVVSRWLWLYFVLTILLTVGIHVAWYVWSRKKERRVQSIFRHVTGRQERDGQPRGGSGGVVGSALPQEEGMEALEPMSLATTRELREGLKDMA